MKQKVIEGIITIATAYVVYRLSPAGESEPPIRLQFWHALMIHSQRGARVLGTLGLHAEKRYREEALAHRG